VPVILSQSSFQFALSGRIVVFAAVAVLAASPGQGEEVKVEHPGAKVYQRMCVDCHGAKGEGVADKHDDPLVGNRSVASLTRYIARSMPDGKEGTCVGDDAANVAAYIFDAFYSPAAQARNNPVRESLARLTVAQYENSVADLIGRFRPGFDRVPGAARGLKARYSGRKVEAALAQEPPEKDEDKRKRKERVSFERVDEQVAFKFASESPDPYLMRGSEFNIRWDGAILVPETGTYEFILKTENGARVWVNDPKDPLIDAWVSTGPDVREERKSIFLLGGRSYPFSVEHFKFKDRSASIVVLWKPPHGREEVIPQAQLLPDAVPPTMVVSTTFPADDRSDGYERGTTISKEWDQATTRAAIEVAAHVEKNLDALAGTQKKASDRVDKLKDFARRFVEAAFRRPMNDEQRRLFVDHHFQKVADPEIAVKRIVLLALKSPRFLYPDLSRDESPDDFSVAARLALDLWDSIPDPRLANAASEGKLRSADQVRNEARRMIADPRTKAKLHGFFHHWLELERAESVSKDAKLFPGFDEAMMADLRQSLWTFLDEVVWSEQSDYRKLIQSNNLWLNERLAKFYGKQVGSVGFERVSFDPNQRAGVITHPYLLASLANNRTTSPIHRGVFLSRNIVGLTLKNPPVTVAFEDAKFDPTLTMREKIVELTRDKSCMACHSTINPFGFSLEHFDAVGRWRTKDNDKPVNARDQFDADDGCTVTLAGPRDIASYAVSSESAHRAFVRQLFHHTVKQPVPAFGESTMETLRAQFAENDFNIQKLLREIAVTSATHMLKQQRTEVASSSP
jgi:mono/diheme cytochrome c family protein